MGTGNVKNREKANDRDLFLPAAYQFSTAVGSLALSEEYPGKELYREAHKCLADCHFMALVPRLYGIRSAVTLGVLDFVVAKTLRFGKPFEWLPSQKFIDGDTAHVGLGCQKRSIFRALDQLEKLGLLCKVKTHRGNMVFYGLNLPNVFEGLRSAVQTGMMKIHQAAAERLEALHRVFSSEKVVRFFEMLFGGVQRVIEDIRKHFNALMELLKSFGERIVGGCSTTQPCEGSSGESECREAEVRPEEMSPEAHPEVPAVVEPIQATADVASAEEERTEACQVAGCEVSRAENPDSEDESSVLQEQERESVNQGDPLADPGLRRKAAVLMAANPEDWGLEEMPAEVVARHVSIVEEQLKKRREELKRRREEAEEWRRVLEERARHGLPAEDARWMSQKLKDLAEVAYGDGCREARERTSLDAAVETARVRAAEASQRSRMRKASERIIGENQAWSQGGRAALRFFEQEVRRVYQNYEEPHWTETRKLVGQARNWVKEMTNAGLTDDDVHRLITAVVEGWKDIRGQDFEYVKAGSDGEADQVFHVTVPMVPSFGFYYPFRRELHALMAGVKQLLTDLKASMRTEARRLSSAAERLHSLR